MIFYFDFPFYADFKIFSFIVQAQKERLLQHLREQEIDLEHIDTDLGRNNKCFKEKQNEIENLKKKVDAESKMLEEARAKFEKQTALVNSIQSEITQNQQVLFFQYS